MDRLNTTNVITGGICNVKIFTGNVLKRLKCLENLTVHDNAELSPPVSGKSS
jgi:hypothetical protein